MRNNNKMDFITLKGDHVVIPDKYLDINFLRHNEVNIPFLSNNINGYTLTISLSKSPTKPIYDRIIKSKIKNNLMVSDIELNDWELYKRKVRVFFYQTYLQSPQQAIQSNLR